MVRQSKLTNEESNTAEVHSPKSGYIKDFITEKPLKYTKEEAVRQTIEHMLVEDYGYTKDQMDIEFKIQRGSKKGAEKADIVIFTDEKRKEQMNIYIVVETEPPEKEFDNQVISYVTATPATFCIWSNGKKTLFFHRPLKQPTIFEPIDQIPRKGETVTDIGKYLKIQLKPSANLKMIFENIHNQLYASANIRRPEKLGSEITKILFCKIYDENNPDPKCHFRGTVEEMMSDEGKGVIASRIKKLFLGVQSDYNDVFNKTEEILLDDHSITFVISKLQHISLTQSDTDVVGKAFEVFVPEELKGTKGEFFTPRPVVRMTVDMIKPSGAKKEKIIDPACGSGGFLIVAMEKAKADIDNKYKKSHLSSTQIEKIKNDYVRDYFYGVDVEPDLARMSKAYMAIARDGRGGIFCVDSLASPSSWSEIVRSKIKLGTFDVLMTNPPFGAKIAITRNDILEQFDLGKEVQEDVNNELVFTDNARKSQVPDILFLERCVELLAPPRNGKVGGRMAIVLPRGILNNPDKIEDKAARKWLLEHTRILAVVDLPKDTFEPYTGTKTSVVFAEKVSEPPEEDYDIFMAISREIGHDKRGNPKYKRDSDGMPILDDNTDMILDIDTSEIAVDYQKFIKGIDFEDSKRSFRVNVKDVKKADRIDASYFSPAAQTAMRDIISSVPRGWQLKTVEDVTIDVFYPGRFKRAYVDKKHGVPFLSGANITRFTRVGVKYLSKNTKNLKEYLVKQGWIFVTRSGTSGILVYADASFNDVAVSEHVIRIVPDETKIDGGYLFAVLNNPIYEPILTSAITGSMVDEITPDFIKKLRIPVPDDRNIQKEIGKSVLEAEKKRVESMKMFADAQNKLNSLLNTSQQPKT